ncbi:hypothetical protein CLV58_109221 [Spirosoma oryzae]|uniref:Uncharacterized protein n=1 Tax=Spirosoma oryzae TaxID=1469603 RepID=A0A2T0SYL4_9BACT|nr:hypothetical protein [Spirosoma oryzae]PRY38494.1 hypothetical protein CLV58_109221 [Spirosoma oryzae]
MLNRLNLSRKLTAGYNGRDGYGTISAVDLIESHPDSPRSRVMLIPVNPNGPVKDCKLEIPTEDLPGFIDRLTAFIKPQ